MAKRNTRRRYKGGAKGKKRTARRSGAASLNITSLGQMDSLKKLMKNTSVIMVFVYADWCGHCQRFKPEWKNLERLPERNVPMVSIRDDVFPKSPLKENVEIEGYPTVAIVNTAQNVTVNVPNREPESLKKLLVNNQNLTSPPPPNMTNKELENQLNELNLTARGTPSGTTIVDVEPDPSPIKETAIDENLNNVPNEISPPPEDSIVKSIEREGSRQLGGGKRRRGLYNSLRQYNSRTE
jgi:thiol-disulfide isomerase/thioredoxin